MPPHATLVVLTGGPGAGKTAVLEIMKRTCCPHVAIAPESASILFAGGFPRDPDAAARCEEQKAIFHVQLGVERVLAARAEVRVVLCDRGTVDGVAYWPGEPDGLYHAVGTTAAAQLARYATVIHLAPPLAGHGYHRNGVRRESALEAAAIDERIMAAWARHPNRYSVPHTSRFLDKAARVLSLIQAQLPHDCAHGTCGASPAGGSAARYPA